MEVLAITPRTKKAALARAVGVLKRGGLVVYPTETSYGVGADATNARAVAAVRRLKGRGAKPMAAIAGTRTMVTRYFTVDATSRCLMDHFWPGALTIILPVKDARLRRARLTGSNQVGVRVPDHPIARELARLLGRPIVATSANVSGRPSCFSLADFLLQFPGRRPDLFLDVGRLPRRVPSTVVVVEDGDIRVLRRGSIRVSSTICATV